jgi:16S rRNA (guanine527-N7)-methyltransferase
MVPEEEKADWERELVEGCGKLGIDLSSKQIRDFRRFRHTIRQWNRPAGLVSPRDVNRLVSRHFLDSLSLLQVLVPLRGARVLDVGSGAGFPGIPLKICRPEIELTLLEPREKAFFYLRQVLRTLSLNKVSVLMKRAESVWEQNDGPKPFDLVLTRALAPLGHLFQICWPLVGPRGIMVAYKGPRVEREMAQAARFIQDAGTGVVSVGVRVPGLSARRCLVLLQR